MLTAGCISTKHIARFLTKTIPAFLTGEPLQIHFNEWITLYNIRVILVNLNYSSCNPIQPKFLLLNSHSNPPPPHPFLPHPVVSKSQVSVAILTTHLICSFHSNQMSDCERFAHIAQDKWATVSESLRLIRGNERMSDLLKKIAYKNLKSCFLTFLVCFIYIFFEKMSKSLISSFLVSKVSESLMWLTKNERCERIAQVTHQKRATMSDSLSLLRGNEKSWTHRLGRSPKMSELLIFLSESLIRSFLDKKPAICLEIKWANSQPWEIQYMHCIHKNVKGLRPQKNLSGVHVHSINSPQTAMPTCCLDIYKNFWSADRTQDIKSLA